jgi:hypothetical protein
MKRAFLALAMLALPAAATGDLSLQPGQWRSSVTIVDALAPAAPALAASMKGKKNVLASCLSATQAPHGLHLLLSGGEAQCRFTSFTVKANHLRSTMVCSGRSGATTTVSTGSFSPTGFDISGTATTAGAIRMTMKTRTIGQRTGSC